jgi:hypothetical protein
VPWTRCADSRRAGCGDSSAEREFPSDKVYRRDDRGIVGVEPFSPHGSGFFSVHTILVVRPGLTVPGRYRWLAPRRAGAARTTVLDADWGELVPVVAGSACLGERRKTRVVNYSRQLRVLPLTIER